MNKFISILKWIFAILFIVIMSILAYIIYPIVYPFRKSIRKARYGGNKLSMVMVYPFWLFLNDDSKYDWGDDWWINVTGVKLDTPWQRFVASYRWSVRRNPTWNIFTFLKPKEGDMVTKFETGTLTKNGVVVSGSNTPWDNFAVLKYVDKDGNYTDNIGEYMSLRHSIIGESFVWYEVRGSLYWRYSRVKKIKSGIIVWLFNLVSSIYSLSNQFDDKDWWTELQLGTNMKRYTIRGKIKKINGIYEEL